MTFKQFKYLDDVSKELVCWGNGVKIADREDNLNYYSLFQVHGFYIEVQYNRSFNTIVLFRAFEMSGLLDPWLDLVNIEDLCKL